VLASRDGCTTSPHQTGVRANRSLLRALLRSAPVPLTECSAALSPLFSKVVMCLQVLGVCAV